MSTRSLHQLLVICLTLILSASLSAVSLHAQTALTFKTIDAPGATETDCNAINTTGSIVGFFLDSSGLGHGFIFTAGAFKKIEVPNATDTRAYGINDAGQIVGTGIYNGQVSAFRLDPVFNESSLRVTSDGGLSASPASVPEPNTLALGGLALLGLMLLKLRRNQ